MSGIIIYHINGLYQGLFNLNQLLPDEFSGRIPCYCKLHNFPGIMANYKMNVESLIQYCVMVKKSIA